MADVKAKFEAALATIQPIRDLARNWDINIASSLDEYLSEIVGDLVDGAPSAESLMTSDGMPNFAHAAVLLQNSSSVYSRKVEYLYALVYKALEDLAATSTNSKQVRKKSSDPDIDDFEAHDQDLEFLLLDDTVMPTDKTESGTKINLRETNEEVFDWDMDSTIVSNGRSSTRLSLGGMSVTKLDRSGMAPATAIRTLMGALNRDTSDAAGGNLRILSQQSDMGPTGILRLPGTADFGSQNSRMSSIGQGGRSSDFMPAAETTPLANDPDEDGVYPMDIDDGHDDDGPGFELAGASEDDDQPVARRVRFEEPEVAEAKPSAKPKFDPWERIDPHVSESTKRKAVKVGKSFRLPPGIELPPSECVTGSSVKRTMTRQRIAEPKSEIKEPLITATFRASIALERRRHERLSSIGAESTLDETNILEDEGIEQPLILSKTLAFGEEFSYIAKRSAKIKAAKRRERRKMVTTHPRAVPQSEADELMGYADHYAEYDDGDDNEPIPYDDNDEEMETGVPEAGDAYGVFGETSHLEGEAFEALCRAHLRAFAKGAEKYATETNLHRRIGEWQSRLAPVLDQEETRPEFDIHCYGQRVVDTVKEKLAGQTLSKSAEGPAAVEFATVTRHSEQYEVCRLFLASLSLSNSGNLRFNAAEGVVSTPASLKVELIKSTIKRPMEKFLAPSVIDADVSQTVA